MKLGVPSPKLRARVADFQDSVAHYYSRAAAEWVGAKNLIQAIAEELSSELSDEDGVVEPKRISLIFNVTMDEKATRAAHASVAPFGPGFRIAVSRSLSDREHKFAMSHEIGHLFFFTLHAPPFRRIIPSAMADKKNQWRQEEFLCDAFARALLIPNHEIFRLRQVKMPRNLVELARRQGVPTVEVVKRVLHDSTIAAPTAVYSISFEPELRVKVFRGTNAKATSRMPTGPELAASIKGLGDLKAIERVTKRLAVGDSSVAYDEGEYWIAVTPSG